MVVNAARKMQIQREISVVNQQIAAVNGEISSTDQQITATKNRIAHIDTNELPWRRTELTRQNEILSKLRIAYAQFGDRTAQKKLNLQSMEAVIRGVKSARSFVDQTRALLMGSQFNRAVSGFNNMNTKTTKNINDLSNAITNFTNERNRLSNSTLPNLQQGRNTLTARLSSHRARLSALQSELRALGA
jgi:DNA repair exonuclease SbcCD ATPase subunit